MSGVCWERHALFKLRFENPGGMKFCGQCTPPLTLVCPKCNAENPPGFKFCGQCTAALTHPAVKSRTGGSAVATREGDEAAAIDGERKIVTALFADIKG